MLSLDNRKGNWVSSEPWEKKIAGAIRASRIGGIFTLIGGIIVILGIALTLRQVTVIESKRGIAVHTLREGAHAAKTINDATTQKLRAVDAAEEEAETDLQGAETEADPLDTGEALAEAFQPSEVMVSATQFDPSLLSLDNAQVSLAGPDSVYISNITYDGQTYSAVLKYRGGTTSTIDAVYGPHGELIPDAVGLSATKLSFVSPDMVGFSYVEIGGDGYSGELRYDGGNRLTVVGIRRVTLTPTEAAEAQTEVSRMRAENESLKALIEDQQKAIAALKTRLVEAADEAGSE